MLNSTVQIGDQRRSNTRNKIRSSYTDQSDEQILAPTRGHISHARIDSKMETRKIIGDDFRNVTILYTDQDNLWCDYVVEKFKSDQLNLKIETVNVTSFCLEDPPEIRNAIEESYVVVLLTTCYLLEYMEKEHHWLAQLLDPKDKNVTTIVVATLDVTSEQLSDVTEKYKYNQGNQWKNMEINVDGSNIKKCITDILGFNDRNALALEKSHLMRSSSYPTKLSSPEAREHIEIIPSTVHQEGEKVALIFSKEKVNGSISVYAGGINIPVETHNPYCVTFNAPAITGTKLYIHVEVNNVKFRRFKLYSGTKTPQFSSVELLCQIYGDIKKEELDKKLAEKFTSTVYVDGYAMMFLEDIFAVSGKRDSQYPTLLHWAAANELRELCSALLSAPGANKACNISNRDDDDVADLAQKNGYVDLANLITDFTETKEMADVCDLYVKACKYPSESETDTLYEIMSPKPTGPPVVPRKPLKASTLPARIDSLPNQCSDEEDNNYITPDDCRMLTPQEFLAANIKYPLALGAIGSRSQTELIEIQEEVKKGNFSIKEAEMLFSSWKARYETGNAISFKERQQSLQAIREQNKKAMEVFKATKHKKKNKGKKNISELSDPATAISEPVGMRTKTGTKQLHFQGIGRGDSGISTDRPEHDSGRYSARDSTLSQTSTSSEEIEFESDKQILRTSRSQSQTGQSSIYRQSIRDQYLQLTNNTTQLPEDGPPPLPPRFNRNLPAANKQQPPQITPKPSFSKMPKQPVPSYNTKVFIKK